jgi:hypothetical protein
MVSRARFHDGERVEIIARREKVVQGVTLVEVDVRLASGDTLTVYADQIKRVRER